MKNLFLNYLAKAMNSYLRLDPESTSRLRKLKGKTLTIELLPFHFIFTLSFSEAGVHLATNEDSTEISTAYLRGTPLQMLGAVITKENRQQFFAEDLSIKGDAELADEVIKLFDAMDIDWEEYLSHFVGDVPAHHTGRFVRKLHHWLDHAKKTVTDNINEYIHEESHWFPTREALQDFFSDIDSLRMDTDRVEMRIKHLRARYEGSDETL